MYFTLLQGTGVNVMVGMIVQVGVGGAIVGTTTWLVGAIGVMPPVLIRAISVCSTATVWAA